MNKKVVFAFLLFLTVALMLRVPAALAFWYINGHGQLSHDSQVLGDEDEKEVRESKEKEERQEKKEVEKEDEKDDEKMEREDETEDENEVEEVETRVRLESVNLAL